MLNFLKDNVSIEIEYHLMLDFLKDNINIKIKLNYINVLIY